MVIADVGHLSMLFSPAVLGAVASFLERGNEPASGRII
jgi:hypothetical protein